MSLLPKTVDPIYILNRDTYVQIDEDLKVDVQRVFLKEIPDKINKVDVSDGTTALVESNSPTNLSSGEYYVDYRIGTVHHHSDEEGKTLSYSYKGTGYINYPSTRVVLKDGNEEVEKTLQDFVDESDQHVQTANEAIDNMNQVVADTNTAKNNANAQAQFAQEQGDYAKQVGDNAKTNWLAPVATFTDVTNTYTSPSHGDTVMTTSDSKVYRYQNGQWDHTQTITDSGISDVQAELAEQDQQTKSLHHGVQVIESDQSSPLKVEFYGNTLVNYISDFNRWDLHANATLIDDKTIELDTDGGSSQMTSESPKVFVSPNENILVCAKTDSTDSNVNIVEYNDSDEVISTNSFNESGFRYKKITTSSDVAYIKVLFYNRSVAGVFLLEKPRFYKISAEVSDKIGVSLTDSDVERLYPYVDSVQHVENPVLSVEGSNLIPPFYECNLHDNANVVSPYELELNATGADQASYHEYRIVQGEDYSFSVSMIGSESQLRLDYRTSDGNYISSAFDKRGVSEVNETFTPPSNAEVVRVVYSSRGSGTITFKNPMLNLGTTAKPFVPYNPSYLYAEVTLAGNSNEKDISFENENGDWIKLKRFETGVVL